MKLWATLLTGLAVLLAWTGASRADVDFLISISGGRQRTALHTETSAFERSQGCKVNIMTKTLEQLKKEMSSRRAQREIGDVMLYYSGPQLRQLAASGAIAPLNGLWEELGGDAAFGKLRHAVSFGDNIYALPLSYYPWAFHYNTKIFTEAGVSSPPKTWDDFLAACEKIKNIGVYPLIMGAKNGWPLGGWFDYLNLRVNGLEFHLQLLAGNIPFTDSRVATILKQWALLINNGYFHPRWNELKWNEALPYMYSARRNSGESAAMYLMGSFIGNTIASMERDNFDFFRFPVFYREAPVFEDAPLDVIVMAAAPSDNEDAVAFLKHWARADIQARYNYAIHMLPPHQLAPKPGAPNVAKQLEILSNTDGYAQFFDRDSHPALWELAKPVLKDFMKKPDVVKTQHALEQARQKVYSNAAVEME